MLENDNGTQYGNWLDQRFSGIANGSIIPTENDWAVLDVLREISPEEEPERFDALVLAAYSDNSEAEEVEV